jgi:hypothetical protein
MEKLGMARRRRRFFTRLLTGILSAAPVFPLIGPDEPLKVLCEADRENLEAGRAFTVALVVNHNEIPEVTVIPPDFQDKFRLDRQRSFTRLVRETTQDTERWSVFEFTLVPLEVGSQTLAPFAVYARGQSVWTTPLPLTIAPARIAAPPTFRWETPTPALTVGQWSVCRLIMTGTLPRPVLQRLRFEPPPEAVVESLTLTAALPSPAAVIELRILPLRPGPLTVKAIEFEAESPDGTIMTLRIPELRAATR